LLSTNLAMTRRGKLLEMRNTKTKNEWLIIEVFKICLKQVL